jgi:hypothetical protein
MTTSTLTIPRAATAAPTPPLTRRSAERLFWRQEWARHQPMWLAGLALWIWLFLVPGPTAAETEVLRWSILWTGALALVLAGDDLRRGIDPLVRTLALESRRRWQMRTAVTMVGGAVFYALGWIASTEEWAWHLWRWVAPGDFSNSAVSQLSPIAPAHGLAVITTIAVVGSLAASSYHGMIPGLLYAAGIWLASHGCAGSHPVILMGIDKMYFSMFEQAQRAAILAGFGVLMSVAAWFIGSHHAAHRAPIATSGKPMGAVSKLIALMALLASVPVVLWTLSLTSGFNPSPKIEPLFPATSMVNHPGRAFLLWGALAWIELFLLAVWWFVQHRTNHGEGASLRRRFHPRWLPWLAGSLAFVHLVGQPAWTFRQIAPELHTPWPFPITPPNVATTQSWAEADKGPQYTSLPPGYDIALWAHYPGREHEPIAWRTGSLSLPANDQSPGTATAFHFDSTSRWPHPIVFEVNLDMIRPRPPAHNSTVGQLQLRLHLSAARSSGESWVSLNGRPLPANLEYKKIAPFFSSVWPGDSRFTGLVWSLVLLPQRPEAPAVERPWHEMLPDTISQSLVAPQESQWPIDLPHSPRSDPGLRGWLQQLRKLSPPHSMGLLLVPIVLLAGLLLRHCRFAAPAILAIALLCLLASVAADARRIQAERTLSQKPTLPPYQQSLAKAKSNLSFFSPTNSHGVFRFR